MKVQLRNIHIPRPIMNPVIKHFKIRMRERNKLFASEAMIQDIIKQIQTGSVRILDQYAGPHKIVVIAIIQNKKIPVVFDTHCKLPYTCFEAI